MKIYTKTGDQGETGLYENQRLLKSHIRIQAIGDLDELNCQLGLLIALESSKEIEDFLLTLQHHCFDLGAGLAGAKEPVLTQQNISAIEKQIDQWQATLSPLKQFILPSGGVAATQCHIARAICRRAERTLVLLAQQDKALIPPYALIFLNRLSDGLFVCARVLTKIAGQTEIVWKKQK